MTTRIREARALDVDAMRDLIDRYADEDRMLSRSRDFLIEHLRDFFVAEEDGAFVGCVALAVLTPDLSEVPANRLLGFVAWPLYGRGLATLNGPAHALDTTQETRDFVERTLRRR